MLEGSRWLQRAFSRFSDREPPTPKHTSINPRINATPTFQLGPAAPPVGVLLPLRVQGGRQGQKLGVLHGDKGDQVVTHTGQYALAGFASAVRVVTVRQQGFTKVRTYSHGVSSAGYVFLRFVHSSACTQQSGRCPVGARLGTRDSGGVEWLDPL